jgi:hypothetical protein
MEQTANLYRIGPSGEAEGSAPSWRRFGSVTAALVAQAEAARVGAPPREEPRFVPVAWAAE